jgi:hypothetical protein
MNVMRGYGVTTWKKPLGSETFENCSSAETRAKQNSKTVIKKGHRI